MRDTSSEAYQQLTHLSDKQQTVLVYIHGHPDNPLKLVVVCDSYTCSQKHEKRFKTS